MPHGEASTIRVRTEAGSGLSSMVLKMLPLLPSKKARSHTMPWLNLLVGMRPRPTSGLGVAAAPGSARRPWPSSSARSAARKVERSGRMVGIKPENN